MCIICGNSRDVAHIDTLGGDVCDNCYNAIVDIREKNLEKARLYFDSISFASEASKTGVYDMIAKKENEVPEAELPSATMDDASEPESVEDAIRNMRADIRVMKNILIFFACLVGAGMLFGLVGAIQLIDAATKLLP